jgi:hypothetical protein
MQLEKAVREIREEIALVKFTSQKKMSDAQSLEANLENSLEVEGRLCHSNINKNKKVDLS